MSGEKNGDYKKASTCYTYAAIQYDFVEAPELTTIPVDWCPYYSQYRFENIRLTVRLFFQSIQVVVYVRKQYNIDGNCICKVKIVTFHTVQILFV